MPYTGKVSNAGISVDTNNDGIPDGRAMTVKNGGNFTTFSLTNGVLTIEPASAGATAGGSDTQVQFNDGSSFGGHSGLVYDKTADSNGGQLTVNKLVVSGDLTVSGTTTTVNTNTVTIADNIIVLNSDATGSASANAGIEIERGDDANVQLLWDETNDRWDFDTYALGSVGKVFASGSGAVYTFTSDTDTGIEHTGTNQLGLLVGNTRVLMVNANGVHIDPSGASGAGSNQALLVDNISIDTNTIAATNTNGEITISANGTAVVNLDTRRVVVGQSGTNATITSNGATDLTMYTNSGTDSGYVTVQDGANNNILLIPNGTGKVGVGQLTPTAKLHVNGDATISGNLTVSGTTTSVSTTNTTVADALITLNQGETGNGITGNIAGFEVDRGEDTGNDNPIARFVFDDSDDKFKAQIETGSDSGTYTTAGLVASTIEGTTGTFSGDVAVDTDTLFVDVSTDRVGINVASPTVTLDVSGDTKVTGNIEITENATVDGRLNANLTTKVQNETGSTLSKGSPVYISATHSSGRPQVSLTDADVSTNKYPAIGLVFENISTGSQGYALTFGVVENVPASLFVGTDPSVGDTVYIASTTGSLTVDRPSSSGQVVQNIGRITKTNIDVALSSGTAHILVQGPGRVNDIPNDVGDEDIVAAASATNYTPTASTVEGHLAGIDTAIGSASYTDADAIAAVEGESDLQLSSLAVDTDTLKVDTTNERVGINEATPDEALHVKGNVVIEDPSVDGTSDHLLEVKSASSSTPDNARILISADTDLKLPLIHLRDIEANSGTFSTHYSAYMGLDRASPIVTGSAQNDLLIANGNYNKDIHFLTNPTSAGTQAQAKMTIAADGDVGIGTTSPIAKLDVASTGTFRATRLLTDTITSSDTVNESDHAGRYVFVSGSSIVVTLPSSHSAGVHFTFLASNAFTLRTGTSGSTGDEMNGSQADISVSQHDGVTCISNGTGWTVLGA